MKRNLRVSAIILTLVTTVSFAFDQGLLDAADDLAAGIEHLDAELHTVGAHPHVIEHVHHTENTVFEFVELLYDKAPIQLVKNEFLHIRTDIREIRGEMRTHKYYGSARVRAEFWHAWTAYRYLDHEFYHGGGPVREL